MDSTKIEPRETTHRASDLRELYRSSEARASRLRLLIEAGRELSTLDQRELLAALAVNARRAAIFAGFRDGSVSFDNSDKGIPLIAPGSEDRRVGTLKLVGDPVRHGMHEQEDREALDMLAQLMAASIDRAERERERDQLLTTLKEREQRLEHLVGRLFTAQEDERRYVSRELHDGVAQKATALFRLLDAQASSKSVEQTEGQRLSKIAKELVGELRAVIGGLRPTVLDDRGLVPAIETLADELRSDGFDVSFSSNVIGEWPQILVTSYFRIAQEALSNVRKHAGGHCKVEVSLSGDVQKNHWRLEIRDHGNGLGVRDQPKPTQGQNVGIEMMRERMTVLGGTLDVIERDVGVSVVAMAENV